MSDLIVMSDLLIYIESFGDVPAIHMWHLKACVNGITTDWNDMNLEVMILWFFF